MQYKEKVKKKITKFVLCMSWALLTSMLCKVNVYAAEGEYDANAALTYAADHWDDNVGECAEFVSNCLNAGGVGAFSRSSSMLHNQLLDSGLGDEYEVFLESDQSIFLANYPEIQPGDVVFYFCPSCVYIDGKPYIHVVLCNGQDDNGYLKAFSHNIANNGESRYRYSRRCYACGTEITKAYVYHFHSRKNELNVKLDEANFPDETFREYVRVNFDKDQNGELSPEEIEEVTRIECSGTYEERGHICSLKGIEYFTKLGYLDCSCNLLTSLDVSNNTIIYFLNCNDNQLTSLDVSKNTELKELLCSENQLTSLDVSKNSAMGVLWCGSNQLTSLDVSANSALWLLNCETNQLTSLDVSKNTELINLLCSENQLTSLNVSKNMVLRFLECQFNKIKTLDLTNCPELLDLMETVKPEVDNSVKSWVEMNEEGYMLRELIVDAAVRILPAQSTFAPGDCNMDGEVNRMDRIRLARAIAGWEGYELPAGDMADLDGNGAVNRADRIQLTRLIAGWN